MNRTLVCPGMLETLVCFKRCYGYYVMKLISILVVSLLSIPPNASWAQVGCNASGSEFDQDIIKIPTFDCAPNGMCNVSVELPNAIGTAKFLGLTLHHGLNDDTNFFVTMAVREKGGVLRGQVFGSREYLDNLDLRVTYSAKETCAIYGRTKLKDHQMRNEVDGSVEPYTR